MRRALVTGSSEHLGSTGAALGRAGFDVVSWEAATPPPGHDGIFDCYVQLPCRRHAPSGAAPSREAVDDLLARIDALAAVAGRLGPTASILLGIDETDASSGAGRGIPAPDLLEAVAMALLEDLGRPAARVAVLPVADLCRPLPDAAALGGPDRGGQWETPTPPLVSAP